jgi:hypothetical protein
MVTKENQRFLLVYKVMNDIVSYAFNFCNGEKITFSVDRLLISILMNYFV